MRLSMILTRAIGRTRSANVTARMDSRTPPVGRIDGAVVLGSLAGSAALVSTDGTVFAANAAWDLFSVSGSAWPPHAPIGTNWFSRCLETGSDYARRIVTGASDVLLTGSPYTIEYPASVRSHECWFAVSLSALSDGSGFLVCHVDVTDRRRSDEMLAYRATHDALSGLPNRALLLDRVGQALARRARLGEPVALLFVDLDRFKLINDTLGHDVGDVALAQVAQRLQRCVRDCDTVGRFGGDEFVVVCEGGDELVAHEIGERIAEAMREPIDLGVHQRVLTASVGIALATELHGRAEDLLRDADAALYEAKDRGRARSEVFNVATAARLQQRVEVEQDLRRAIDLDEFTLHYQPQIDMVEGRVVGAEALVRWNHPRRGLVAPNDFIPIAEESGLIGLIDRYALFEACRQLQEWRSTLRCPPHTLSINLSGHDFADPGIVDTIAAALARFELEPRMLSIELTESVLMTGSESTLEALRAIRDLGCFIAADDFGTGYSSLASLKQLPVEILKIDQSFVDGLGVEPGDTAIVASIMSLAHAMGLHVVAEGVETSVQARELQALGCTVAQGFLYARPMAAAEFGLFVSSAKTLRGHAAGTRRSRMRSDAGSDLGAIRPNLGRRLLIDEFMQQMAIPMEDQ